MAGWVWGGRAGYVRGILNPPPCRLPATAERLSLPQPPNRGRQPYTRVYITARSRIRLPVNLKINIDRGTANPLFIDADCWRKPGPPCWAFSVRSFSFHTCFSSILAIPFVRRVMRRETGRLAPSGGFVVLFQTRLE